MTHAVLDEELAEAWLEVQSVLPHGCRIGIQPFAGGYRTGVSEDGERIVWDLRYFPTLGAAFRRLAVLLAAREPGVLANSDGSDSGFRA